MEPQKPIVQGNAIMVVSSTASTRITVEGKKVSSMTVVYELVRVDNLGEPNEKWESIDGKRQSIHIPDITSLPSELAPLQSSVLVALGQLETLFDTANQLGQYL